LPRTLTILFPDGHREYWFTDQVFERGDCWREAPAPGSWWASGSRTMLASTPPSLSERVGGPRKWTARA